MLLESQIRDSDGIILVYDASREGQKQLLNEVWMKLVRSCNQHIPVILVANKCDLEVIEFWKVGQGGS